MINKNFLKNKFIFLFIPIILSEIYYLKGNYATDANCIDIYSSGLFNLYSKGIIIFLLLLILYLLISEFDKNIVVLRYKNLNLWVREIFRIAINYCTYIVIIINVVPLLFTLTLTNYTIKDFIVMIMYIINQLAAFYILSFIYITLFILIQNKLHNFIIIFLLLYIPKYLLDALRKNYLTPIDLIFFNSNIKFIDMLIQTNLMIILAGVVIYMVQNSLLNSKDRDLIWRS